MSIKSSMVDMLLALGKQLALATLCGLLMTTALLAQAIPPPRGPRDRSPVSDHFRRGQPAVFQSFQPCRIIDTRGPAGPFGGPKFAASETRTYNIPVGGLCDSSIPPGATAVAINVTVTETEMTGYLTIFPADIAQPFVSSANWYGPGQTVANSLIVPLSLSDPASLKIFAIQSTHVVVDVSGYFLNDLANGDFLSINANSGSGTAAVLGNNSGVGAGVWGAHQGSGFGFGVNGTVEGLGVGVRGFASPGGGGLAGRFDGNVSIKGNLTTNAFSGVDTAAVLGNNFGIGTGVWGAHQGSGIGVNGSVVGNGVGVRGFASPAGGGLAGSFVGNVSINGNLAVSGTKSFKIDHPLDPENKYLYHASVESPEMMNMYNGNIITDRKGRATIILPDYFTALNHDYRYQLTVIGQFARAIVTSEIKDNRFTIKTDKPHVKVSWQVTGIRQDAWAEAHRMKVEENKPEKERGSYLHPEVFNQPEEKGVEKVRYSEKMQLMQEKTAKQSIAQKQ